MNGAASAASVPPGCWRVGPLVLGVTATQVRRALGAPDAAFTADTRNGEGRGHPYEGAAYLFPRGLATRLARNPAPDLPAHRFLKLLFAAGRLVRIDTEVSEAIESGRCPDGRPAPAGLGRDSPSPREGSPPEGFAPFLRFATVRVGDTPRRLAAALGPPATVNRSRDWRAYSPAPLTFAGEDAIWGFSVSADADAQFAGGFTPRLVLHRSAEFCRIDDVALR